MDVCLRQLDTTEALVVKGTLNPDSLNLNGIAYLILGFHIEPLDHGIPWVSSATAKIGKTFAVTGRVSRPEHNGQSTFTLWLSLIPVHTAEKMVVYRGRKFLSEASDFGWTYGN